MAAAVGLDCGAVAPPLLRHLSAFVCSRKSSTVGLLLPSATVDKVKHGYFATPFTLFRKLGEIGNGVLASNPVDFSVNFAIYEFYIILRVRILKTQLG